MRLGALRNGWPAFGSGRVAAKRPRATTRLVSTSGNKIREGATMNAIERPGSGIVPRNDLDRFRLRRFLDDLAGTGEIEMREGAGRYRRYRGDSRRQYEGRALPRRRAGAAGTGRQCAVEPRAPCPRIRGRTGAAGDRDRAPACRQAADRRTEPGRGARAGGRAYRRRRRPHGAAGASSARPRRRALYLGLDRLHDRPENRLDQCRHPPADAARAARSRRRPGVAERPARALRGERRRRQAAAGELRGRRAARSTTSPP